MDVHHRRHSGERLVWLDLEMTSAEPSAAVLEAAVVVTESGKSAIQIKTNRNSIGACFSDLSVVASTSAVLHCADEELAAKLNSWSLDTHTASGLLRGLIFIYIFILGFFLVIMYLVLIFFLFPCFLFKCYF